MDENTQREKLPQPKEQREPVERIREQSRIRRNETIEEPVKKRRRPSEASTPEGTQPIRRTRPVEGAEGSRPVRKVRRPAGAPAGSRPAGAPAGSRPVGAPAGSRPVGAIAGSRPVGTPAGSRPVGTPAGSRPVGTPAGSRPVEPTRKKRVPVATEPLKERRAHRELEVENATEEPIKKTVLTTGSHEMKKRSVRSKRRRRGCIYGAVFLMVLGVLAALGGALYMKKYGLSSEEMNASKYYDTSRTADLAVILDNEIIGVGGMVDNDVYYLSFDFVQDYLNDRFYWDSTENTLLYTLEDGTVSAVVGESQYSKGQDTTQTDYPIVKTEGEEVYVAAEFVQQYTNIDYSTFADPNRIVITSEWVTIEYTTAKKDTEVRYQAGVKSPIVSYVTKGDKLIYLEQDVEDWTKVCTLDGYIGYIQTKNVDETETETLSRAFEEQTYTNISKDGTINLAFHQVTTDTVNDSILSTIADTKGLTTIAPTWFFISNTEGDVTSLASETYVNYAHQLGLEVWAVLNDFDGGMNSQSETLEVLSSTAKREKIINTIIAEAIQTGIDGINVDIENVSTEAGDHYIQFIRELSVKCRQNGLVLSVDNYPPKAYNMHYNYEEQGIVADYLIIMSYDEHYSGSLEAGSVSSITYVEEAVTEMLTMVSADKIINAIPFYTRLWLETPKTEEELAAQAGTAEAEYPNNVSSETYGMANAVAVVEEAGATATWDETTQQNYATWTVDETTYQIWLEDEASIEAKLQVMQEYNLAGTAAWKLGFETSEIWNIIQKYVN
ncbi:MAG: glycosyl hydrolase family 18 protein [Eubacteriales bacterium]